ncbi:hypothetical protein [Sarcina ventriculi]|uniref:hypothetical protein n=1 Tax=Sarcina ventriculi TaxID=1267 RepID=UPI00073F7CDA|nr:hypothetical protein [Sarcina ventriculi]
MKNELLMDYIGIVRNYLNYTYSDKIEVSDRNALTFFYLAKYSNIKEKKLTDEETIKSITKGENDKGICGIYMNDENSDILEVHLIKTRYINAFNKCSLTEEDMNETINNFKEFPYIKDCNESINYWQKRFLECKDKFKEIKIKFVLLTNGYVSPYSKKKALENSINVFDKEGAIFIHEAIKIIDVYKFEKLDYYNNLEVKKVFNDESNINLRRIIMIYNLRAKIETWLYKSKVNNIIENLINKNSREEVMNYMLYIFVKLVKFYDVKTVEDRIELLKYNFDKFVNNIDEDNKVLEITTLEEPFISTIKLFLHDSDILIDNQLIELKWDESHEKAFIRAFNSVKK